MKISCQSCQAKYTIADEKVVGKVVKIRCKKCSSTIVINGNEALEPPEDATQATNVFDYTAGSSETWTVNVADGDQRTLTSNDIVREYQTGVVNDETYCWKDGMADWLPLREIEQLYRLTAGGPRPSLQMEEPQLPQYDRGGYAAPAGSLFGGQPEPEHDHYANGNGRNANLFGEPMAAGSSPAPTAARRQGRGGGGDLFGGAAQAGGEEDVMTSASAKNDDKLTGQRNESSVLFSLTALTKESQSSGGGGGGGGGPFGGGGGHAVENRTTAQSDGSGLIDIRALSANMGGDSHGSSQKNHVDDIMNLSGGGAFGAALGAPILAPPPMEISAQDQQQQQGSGKGIMIGLLGGFAFLSIAIVVVVVVMMRQPKPAEPIAGLNTGPTTGTTGATAAPSVTVSAGPTDTASANATDPKSPTAGSAGTAKAPVGVGTGATTAVAATTKATTDTPPKATATATTPPTPTATSLGDAINKAVAPTATVAPPPPAGGTSPFDRGAAAATLGSVNVNGCKKPDGPTGSGHVTVTFGPDGSVQSANVDQPPFSGTAVGGCIAGKYRVAHVPPFAGSPVKVGKSFTVN